MVDILYVSESNNQHDVRFEKRWQELGLSIERIDASQIEPRSLLHDLKEVITKSAPHLIQVGPLHKLPNLVLDIWSGPTLTVSWGYDLLGPDVKANNDYREAVINALNRSSAVLVDSLASLRVVEKLGTQQGELYYLPWGVEQSFLKSQRLKASRKVDVKNKLTFITTRNHESIYNVELVIKSFLDASVSGSKLLVAGTGSQTEHLKQVVDSNVTPGIEVEFLGRLTSEEMVEALLRSNFYISAALVDGSSVSLLEAMALGLVPIVPNLPGNREWVGTGAGYMFDLNTPKLTELIREVSKDSSNSLNTSMSILASESIAQNGDWARNSKLLRTIYEDLVGGSLR
jgi:glycosyltransferase involved in cell wall biosynthesis